MEFNIVMSNSMIVLSKGLSPPENMRMKLKRKRRDNFKSEGKNHIVIKKLVT